MNTTNSTPATPTPVSVEYGAGSYDARAILANHPTVESYIAATENDEMFKVYKKEGGYRDAEIKAFYEKVQDAVKAGDAKPEVTAPNADTKDGKPAAPKK